MGAYMKELFVFGSNQLGIHKKGAALDALNKYGALLGQGEGLQGSSYAIPTKSTPWKTLPLVDINKYVATFLQYATYTQGEYIFNVTRIGCGLAGYTDEQIAPMFRLAIDISNIRLPKEWKEILG